MSVTKSENRTRYNKAWTDEEKQRFAEAVEKMRHDLRDIADA